MPCAIPTSARASATSRSRTRWTHDSTATSERSSKKECASGSGGRVCFAPGGRDLVIDKLERSDELQPWDPDWQRHVALTKGGRIWIVATRVDDPGEYRALVVHELGHHLGIGHIEDTPATYMHSTINDTPPELWLHASLPKRDGRAFCEVRRCTCSH
jgi:hypothetical protein